MYCYTDCLYAQSSSAKEDSSHLKKVRYVIWYTPALSTDINGLAIGIAPVPHAPYKHLTVRGVNIDVNPFFGAMSLIWVGAESIVAPFVSDTTDVWNDKYMGKEESLTTVHGVNLSPTNLWADVNGLDLGIVVRLSYQFNGIAISGLMSVTNRFNGIQIGGLRNKTTNGRGVMLGLFNNAKNFKGIQIGLLNSIGNLTLPFLNVKL